MKILMLLLTIILGLTSQVSSQPLQQPQLCEDDRDLLRAYAQHIERARASVEAELAQTTMRLRRVEQELQKSQQELTDAKKGQ